MKPRLIAKKIYRTFVPARGQVSQLVRREPGEDYAKANDDFNWAQYHHDYRTQIGDMETANLLRLQPGMATFIDGNLRVDSPNGKQLHANHHALYEAIGMLAPQSATEIGCGGGDHMHNLGLLFPHMQLRGYDRSQEQLNFLRERSPHLADKVAVLDATMPPAYNWTKTDVVYSQAVIMHIQAANSHLVALANMFSLAGEQVVLMENWQRHQFQQDIMRLHRERMIEWADLHFHTHSYNGNPHVLIVSRTKLALPVLNNYQDLIDNM